MKAIRSRLHVKDLVVNYTVNYNFEPFVIINYHHLVFTELPV